MGENIYKQCKLQACNLQNIQTTHTTKQQKKKKTKTKQNKTKKPKINPVGQKTEIDISPRKTYRWPTGTRKNAQHQ